MVVKFKNLSKITLLFKTLHFAEVLRLYPPVGSIHRMTVEDYRLPNGSILPSGTAVLIPNLGFQRDPDLFPNPMQFDPDRFSDENKQSRHSFCSLPFGEGPRYFFK